MPNHEDVKLSRVMAFCMHHCGWSKESYGGGIKEVERAAKYHASRKGHQVIVETKFMKTITPIKESE